MIIKTITVEAFPGETIEDVYMKCQKMMSFFSGYGQLDSESNISFTFNGVRCMITNVSRQDLFLKQYNDAIQSIVTGVRDD